MRISLCRFATLVVIVLLSGCKQILYSDLTERQANEMVAVLASAGIESSRERDKKNIYAISVDESQIAVAITILKNNGLPRETFQNLGDIFSADGIVGTPFEERARFAHAMNEELSHTISEISGVRTARVHIMLPEVTRYSTDEDPARASIVIHVDSDFSEGEFLPTIKNLVAHSVANLEYENVAVAVFPASGPVIVLEPASSAGHGSAEAGTYLQPQIQGVPFPTATSQAVNLNIALLVLGAVLILWTMILRTVGRMRIRWRGNG